MGEAQGKVVLVGHSGGGAVAHAVADARPDRIARVVHVDAGPLSPGEPINDELPIVGGAIPFPGWEVFSEDEVRDLDETIRRDFEARAIPHPAAAATDPMVLRDERRYDVPTTIIASALSSDLLREWLAQEVSFVAELAAMRGVTYIDLPTGHWPQLTKPQELGRAIVDAVSADPAGQP